MNIKIFFKILTLVLFSFSAFSQKSVKPIFGFGIAIPTGNESTEVYNFGLQGTLGLITPITSKVSFIPKYEFIYYGNKPIEEVTESLKVHQLNLEIDYNIYVHSELKISPIGSLGLGLFNNDVKDKDADDAENLMNGIGIPISLGCKVSLKRFYARLKYQYFDPKISVSDEITSEVERDYGLYQLFYIPKQRIDLSSISLMIGIEL